MVLPPEAELPVTGLPDLNFSSLFDVHRWSDYPQVNKVCKVVYDDILKQYTAYREEDEKKLRKQLKVLLIDLFANYSADPDLFISISLNKNDYGQKTRYDAIHLSYRLIKKMITLLSSLGYIEHYIGYLDRATGIGRVSRIRSSSKLTALFKGHKLSTVMVKHNPDMETIRLRQRKKEIEYQDNEFTFQSRANTKRLNIAYQKTYIDLNVPDALYFQILKHMKDGDPDKKSKKKRWRNGRYVTNYDVVIDFTRKYLVRIFNDGSLSLGGRFYWSWYQGIPSKYRKYIEINGASIVELDYSGMHPKMLYANEGLIPPVDPYMLPNFQIEQRGALKEVLNAMINMPESKSILKTICQIIPKRDLPDGYKKSQDLVDAYMEMHKPISHYFHKGYGRNLQFQESLIAEQVMLKMLSWRAVVLPVHDSFIVRAVHLDMLKEAMVDAFVEHTGLDPIIKKDLTVFDVIESNPNPNLDTLAENIEWYKNLSNGRDPYSLFHGRRTEWYKHNPMTYQVD